MTTTMNKMCSTLLHNATYVAIIIWIYPAQKRSDEFKLEGEQPCLKTI